MTKAGNSLLKQKNLAWSEGAALLVCAACLLAVLASRPAVAQDFEKPVMTIDEDITAFAFAPDGRIVFAVNRPFKTKQYDLEHDDVWMQEAGGKRKRIFIGEKFQRGAAAFTYSVNSFRWSPNGHLILAELFTASVDESGKTVDAPMTLVLDESGKEVKMGEDNVIKDASKPTWLQDNATVIYFSEVLKPKVLFAFHYTNRSGAPGLVFEGRTFLDAVPIPGANYDYAVERDKNMSGPPRLQKLELLAQDDKEIATLDGYEGGLALSPSATKIAYYIDKEVIEIRDLTAPNKFARVRAGYGVFRWAPDETKILLKRSVEKKSGDLVWIAIPALVEHAAGSEIEVAQPIPVPILRGLTYREFAFSPDGKYIGVIVPGRRNLAVYPVPQ
jgi:dipeptidyl aminopeptidase/acylaminoacyl peptidase